MNRRSVFITGATGYMGRSLIPVLLARGHHVRALVRQTSAHRVPPGAETVLGNALDPATFADAIAPADTLVHLIGTPHPSPAKAASFQAVDLASVDAALSAALAAGVRHFVYVSVAHPAPVMQAYIAARQAAEARIRASGIEATILRPWYVLGPGHRWPQLLLPLYAILTRLPLTRQGARRLGLVTLEQMVRALVASIEQGPEGVRVLDVPAIRGAHADPSAGMKNPLYRGSCLCGSVQYEVTSEIGAVSHCHCSMCRKAHGAAFGTYARVRLQAHAFTQGAALVREYRSSTTATRLFCSVCGSPLAWHSEGEFSAWLSFPLGTLDTAYLPPHQRHIHVASKAPWHIICDGWPQSE